MVLDINYWILELVENGPTCRIYNKMLLRLIIVSKLTPGSVTGGVEFL